MVSPAKLASVLESLCDSRVRPWNVATIAASAWLTGLFADRSDQINEIAIAPPEPGQVLTLKSLGIYPAGWADLIVLDSDCCSSIQPDQLWGELVRIAARQGLMAVLSPEASQARSHEFAVDPLPTAMACYVQSFGTESWPGAARSVYWARRNARPYLPATVSTNDMEMVTRQIHTLSNYIDQLTQSLPQPLGSELLSNVRTVSQSRSDETLRSLARGVYVKDLEDMIANLQCQLEQSNQSCRAAQAELESLQRRYTSVRLALAGSGRPAQIEGQHETVPDELVVEILSLRRQLSDMTARYLQMRDHVHALVNSESWRSTWLPRRVLDLLKAALNTSGRLFLPQLPQPLRLLKAQLADGLNDPAASAQPPAAELDTVEKFALPAAVESSQVAESAGRCDDQLASFEQDPEFWQQLWTGTFLTLHDNATTSSRHRLDRILFVDWRLPEPDQDSGSCRIYAILEIVVSLGLRVDFISDLENQRDKYRDALLDLGIHVIEGRAQAWRHLQRFGSCYRHCFVCRPEPASFFFPLIRCYCPEAQLIYDTVDLHYLRMYRASQLSSLEKGERAQQLSLHYQYKTAETFLAKSADCVVVVTELEKEEVLKSIAPAATVAVIPNIHELPKRSSLPDWGQRKDILFVGGFDHAPNVDAVCFFCEQILPLVLPDLPGLTFHIVGSNMPDVVHDLKGDHVNPIGYVEDLRKVFDRVRVSVAPLRYGAGIKGKVGQSMSYGVPVVGTSIAFEGFGILDQYQGMIADQPEAFAKALVKTYLDRELWLTLSNQAWSLIQERFSKQAIRKSLQALLQIEPS